MKRVVLIGGCGFVGLNLCQRLKDEGFSVILIDIIPCPDGVEDNYCKYFCGSAADRSLLTQVFTQFPPDIVIIIASWGMSGSEMLSSRCFKVNVAIASECIAACILCGIPHLIYTSTYNVVFGGELIEGGDESLSPFPIELHTDCYSASKYMAESLVLRANGARLRRSSNLAALGISGISGSRSSSNGDLASSTRPNPNLDHATLRTLALRPAAIYGEGEQRHFPRILAHMHRGLFLAGIGNATVDWLHIDNLVIAWQCYLLCLLPLWASLILFSSIYLFSRAFILINTTIILILQCFTLFRLTRLIITHISFACIPTLCTMQTR